MTTHDAGTRKLCVMKLILPLAAALVLPAGATAAPLTYKVVSVSHSSSSAKHTNDYSGTSTAHWSLAKPAKITISPVAGTIVGLTQVAVNGTYSIDATTKLGHCAWTAATGDTEHPLTAPAPFQLSFGPDPDTGKGILAGFGTVPATLGNAYLGTECSTDASGEPDVDELGLDTVKPSELRGKKLTLKSGGSTNRDGLAYTWKTRIVLKKVAGAAS